MDFFCLQKYTKMHPRSPVNYEKARVVVPPPLHSPQLHMFSPNFIPVRWRAHPQNLQSPQLHNNGSASILPRFNPCEEVDWKRPSGCPRKTWLQQVEEDTGLSVGAAQIASQDRSMWRTLRVRPLAGQAQ